MASVKHLFIYQRSSLHSRSGAHCGIRYRNMGVQGHKMRGDFQCLNTVDFAALVECGERILPVTQRLSIRY